MRRLAAGALAVLAALVVAAGARADYVIDGRGFGHGVGMSQYGAYGYALREGRDAQWTVGHFYTGTTVATTAATAIRVRLKAAGSAKVCSARSATGANGGVYALREDRAYRLAPYSTSRLEIVDTATGGVVGHPLAPVTIADGTDGVCLRGVAENGVDGGFYRGTLILVRDGTDVLTVNRLSL